MSNTLLAVVSAELGAQPSVCSEPNAAVREILNASSHALKPASSAEEAISAQWLSLCSASDAAAVTAAANSVLAGSSFLSGPCFGLADLCVYLHMGSVADDALRAAPHACRWYDAAQHNARRVLGEAAAAMLPAVKNLGQPLALGDVAGLLAAVPKLSASTGEAKAAGGGAKGAAESKEGAAESKAGGGKKEKKEKKEKKPKAKKGAKEEEKKDELLPNIMEVRVGVMQKVWAHEDADKLYCEEIDLGEEGGPRGIASGLRDYYASAEELQGKRVLVLCNLKPKNARGFTSNGMVLCAVSEDHTQVKLLEAPEGAQVGERVVFEGIPEAEPAKPAHMQKKKYLEKLLPGLKTDADGVATWNGHKFTTSGGPCTAPLSNVPIS